jgi:hypothetical protein
LVSAGQMLLPAPFRWRELVRTMKMQELQETGRVGYA